MTSAPRRPVAVDPVDQRPRAPRVASDSESERPNVVHPAATVDELDPVVGQELRGLGADRAEAVTLRLVSAAAWLADGDETSAVAAADSALALGARLAVVREAVGLVHYRVGDWARALRELRTARRMGAGAELLPVLVDCERALGRPERALALATGPDAEGLDRPTAVELAMVVSGIRRDLGDLPAALRALRVPELGSAAPAWARLSYAHADLLAAAGRPDDARAWFARAAAADRDGDTDAADRVLEMDGTALWERDDGFEGSGSEGSGSEGSGPEGSGSEGSGTDDPQAEPDQA